MTPNTLPLSRMTRQDKLRAMESLWADLSAGTDGMDSPAWHGEVLSGTRELVAAGKARFSRWEDAKSRLRRKTVRKP